MPSHMFIGKLVAPGLAFEKVALGPEDVNSGDYKSSKLITILLFIFELLVS